MGKECAFFPEPLRSQLPLRQTDTLFLCFIVCLFVHLFVSTLQSNLSEIYSCVWLIIFITSFILGFCPHKQFSKCYFLSNHSLYYNILNFFITHRHSGLSISLLFLFIFEHTKFSCLHVLLYCALRHIIVFTVSLLYITHWVAQIPPSLIFEINSSQKSSSYACILFCL